MRAETVIEAGTAQPVAMRDLNRIHPSPVERPSNVTHGIEGILMADGMHAVAQGDVLDVELLLDRIEQRIDSFAAEIPILPLSALGGGEVG